MFVEYRSGMSERVPTRDDPPKRLVPTPAGYGKQKVVYHVNYDDPKKQKGAMRNIQNHINAVGAENMDLRVVMHGKQPLRSPDSAPMRPGIPPAHGRHGSSRSDARAPSTNVTVVIGIW